MEHTVFACWPTERFSATPEGIFSLDLDGGTSKVKLQELVLWHSLRCQVWAPTQCCVLLESGVSDVAYWLPCSFRSFCLKIRDSEIWTDTIKLPSFEMLLRKPLWVTAVIRRPRHYTSLPRFTSTHCVGIVAKGGSLLVTAELSLTPYSAETGFL